MSSLLFAALIVAGAFIAMRAFKKEWRRVNRDLHQKNRDEKPIPLRQDPQTGVWGPAKDSNRP